MRPALEGITGVLPRLLIWRMNASLSYPLSAIKLMGMVFGQQAGSLGHIVRLSRREAQFDWTPSRIHGDEFAARTAEGFVVAPFFLAPAACW